MPRYSPTVNPDEKGIQTMQIQFDPRDRNACASVISVIAILHGDQAIAVERPSPGIADADADADTTRAAEAFADLATTVPTAPLPVQADTSPDDVADPAPSAPAAPAPSSASVPPAATGAEVDTTGLPWDKRIHAGKATEKLANKNGSWRRRRGVDDATVEAVEAELRQAMNAPAPVNADPTPAAPAAPEVAPVAPGTDAAAPVPAPPVPTPTPPGAATVSGADVAGNASEQAAVVPPPPPTAPTGEPTFADLMRRITSLQTAGKLTVTETQTMAESLGLTSIRDLIHRADLVASFAALLPEA